MLKITPTIAGSLDCLENFYTITFALGACHGSSICSNVKISNSNFCWNKFGGDLEGLSEFCAIIIFLPNPFKLLS